MRLTEDNSHRREDRLEARVGRDAKALCKKAARLQGRTLTDFVVHSAVEAAQRTIRESEFIELTLRDRTAFVEALLKPAPPNARLREAARRHAQTVVG